ncbi:MAG: TonB-dependent receptor [Pseudomonas sp.]
MPAGKREAVLGLLKVHPIAMAIIGALSASAAASAQDASTSETQKGKEPVELEQITVTATGREARATDIPYNISVMNEADLRRAGVTDLAELARQIPGMVYTDLGARNNATSNGIILRGLNGTSSGVGTSDVDQTVSTYINGTPLFSNIKINDVERVEVLRGPQGTLYGAGSVGGTVRFILNKPDTSGFYGDVQTKASGTAHSDDPSYGTDLMLNLPVSDTLAFRIVAGYEKDGGYTDAANLMQYASNGTPLLADSSDYFGSAGVFKSKKDVDDSSIRYGRLALLWNISENDSLLFTVAHQDNRASDFSGESPYVAKDYVSTRYRESPSRVVNDLYSLEYSHDFGFATLTSSSSYTRTTQNANTDYTNFAIRSESWYAGYPRSSYNMDTVSDSRQYTQELRLVSKTGGAWDWVAGAYYSKYSQDATITGYIPGWAEYTNTAGHPTAVAETGDSSATWADYYQTYYPNGTFDSDVIYLLQKKSRYSNKALYGELTRNLSDKWQVTAGARAFRVDSYRYSYQTLPYQGSDSDIESSHSSSDSDHIFKLNTSYHLGADTMAYFTWSQGYRQGGSNAIPTAGNFAVNAPLVDYGPDRATNWEIGMKGTVSGWLQYSAALYRIYWDNVQIKTTAPKSGIPITANAGNAISQGLELEVKAQLSERLYATLGYAYTDAHLTKDYELVSGDMGYKGDRLPGVPKNTASASLNYVQPTSLFGGSDITYRLDGACRSGVHTALNEDSSNYVELGGFTTWNASATWHGQALRVGVFVNNITDQKGVTAVATDSDTTPGSRPGTLYFTQRPRTIGVTVGYAF